MEAGFTPETFWRQTERSYCIAVEAVAERQKRSLERDRMMAWNTAALTGAAMAGKLKPLSECFGKDGGVEATPGSNQLLSFLFKMKHKGVEMTVERISRAGRTPSPLA